MAQWVEQLKGSSPFVSLTEWTFSHERGFRYLNFLFVVTLIFSFLLALGKVTVALGKRVSAVLGQDKCNDTALLSLSEQYPSGLRAFIANEAGCKRRGGSNPSCSVRFMSDKPKFFG